MEDEITKEATDAIAFRLRKLSGDDQTALISAAEEKSHARAYLRASEKSQSFHCALAVIWAWSLEFSKEQFAMIINEAMTAARKG